jgi:PST family polysaccharide transporter
MRLEVDLRRRAARGTIVNAVFQVGVAGLLFLRRFLVAVFLTPSEFGVWGALVATLFIVLFLKDLGIGDKFVQQDEEDQERAFQKAFTIDLVFSCLAWALTLVVLPIAALAYDEPSIILPGLLLSLNLPLSSFWSPIWIFYRHMQFVRQRLLMSVEPVVGFVVTIALAAGGAGYWGLVIGSVVGVAASAVVAVAVSPYRLAFVWERGTLREYWSFSWPLAVASGGGLVIGQATALLAARGGGFDDVGIIGLAITITMFTGGVNRIVMGTLYPAICAVRDRADVMYEAFEKSNKLSLMWGVPFGAALALFADDLVTFVLGSRWSDAVVVLQAFGVAAALGQIACNWAEFLRALDHTRPLAVLAVINLTVFAVLTAPLLLIAGLEGYAVAIVVAQVVTLTARLSYVKRIFPPFPVVRHGVRALWPVLPGVGAVLLARLAESGDRTSMQPVAELAIFVGATVATTLVSERALLREALGYLLPEQRPAAAAPL